MLSVRCQRMMRVRSASQLTPPSLLLLPRPEAMHKIVDSAVAPAKGRLMRLLPRPRPDLKRSPSLWLRRLLQRRPAVARDGLEAVGAEDAVVVEVFRQPLCRWWPKRKMQAKRPSLLWDPQLPRKGSNEFPASKQGFEEALHSFRSLTSPQSFAGECSRCRELRANCVAHCVSLSAPA